MANQAVQLTVRPFGVIKDPISDKEEEVMEYIWMNAAKKTVIKVRVDQSYLLFLSQFRSKLPYDVLSLLIS